MNKDRVKEGDTIAVWFSCGAASAVTAKRTIDLYGDICNIRILNNPVIEEHPDNLRFKDDIENWLDHEIETVINDKYQSCSAVDVWDRRHYMSGNRGAPCTLELKKKARQQWEDKNDCNWHVLGFTADESHRAINLQAKELPELLSVAINQGLTKNHCFQILNNAGILQVVMYRLGFPNANCIGCVKASSPTYWNMVRLLFPQIFWHRAEQSRDIGCRLVRVKGKRIYLDELDRNARGNPLKEYQIDCGIFCENAA